jgi:diguanylate cyclase (GGDEF)-like protein
MPQTDSRPSATPGPAPDPEHLRLTAELAQAREQVALLTAQLAEAEQLADRDVLTPLLNRRAFLREVQRAIAIARRYKSPASVIYFDLNDFKGINDRYGHAAGDAVLIAVAERLLAAVRAEDVVGRIGGDEFAVLLQRADSPAGTAKAQALLDTVAGAPVPFQHRSITIGVTFGVREIGAADSAEQALAEADANMYLRKPHKPARE